MKTKRGKRKKDKSKEKQKEKKEKKRKLKSSSQVIYTKLIKKYELEMQTHSDLVPKTRQNELMNLFLDSNTY